MGACCSSCPVCTAAYFIAAMCLSVHMSMHDISTTIIVSMTMHDHTQLRGPSLLYCTRCSHMAWDSANVHHSAICIYITWQMLNSSQLKKPHTVPSTPNWKPVTCHDLPVFGPCFPPSI